jgi:orotate phosphoribosyltransferase
MSAVRGGPVEGRSAVLVTTLVRSGEGAELACRALRAAGALVSTLVCVIDAQEHASERLARSGVLIRSLTTARSIRGDNWKAMLPGG